MCELTKALIYTNTAYLLADVANSLMVDVEAILTSQAKEVKYGELKQFKTMLSDAKSLRERTRKVTKPLYEIKDYSALDDSDWLLDIILLIVDRVGDNDDKAVRLRELIKEQPTELNLYEVCSMCQSGSVR